MCIKNCLCSVECDQAVTLIKIINSSDESNIWCLVWLLVWAEEILFAVTTF
jgi:hypothetical protein